MSCKIYQGSDESVVLKQAQAEHPDGFEILSIRKAGWLWWRSVELLVQPLDRAPRREMARIRLLSAILAQREQRLMQAAQHAMMAHAQELQPSAAPRRV
jgi:hypothetical protein